MKNIRAGTGFLILVACSSLGACYHHPLPINDALLSLYASSESSQSRGERLTIMMCAGCHYNQHDDALSGARVRDLPGYVGEIWSANLTHGASGIKHYSRQALAELIRTGRMTNGKVSPFMGSPQIAPQDLQQMLDFLQSKHRLLRPINRTSPKSRLSWLSRLYLMVNPVQATVPINNSVAPEDRTQAQHGEYLVAILDCYICHSKSLARNNRQSPTSTPGYMAGGARLTGIAGKTIRGANLTPDRESGIGTWNVQQFISAMRVGARPGGHQLRLPMPRYSQLTKHELESIFTYLHTLPPVRNPIPRNF